MPSCKPYRTFFAFFGVFIGPQLFGQTKPAPAPAPDPTSVLVTKQAESVAKMTASLDQQKASINKQIGLTAPAADAFFTASWLTPLSIPTPKLVAPCSPMPEADLSKVIATSAKTEDVKPELIRAVVRRESAFYPCAVSDRGAVGLMQLMPEVADQFSVDPLDPAQNVAAGTKYLKQLLTRYKGDVKLALAAYNAGPQRVDADHKIPDIPETLAYVDTILKDLNQNSATKR